MKGKNRMASLLKISNNCENAVRTSLNSHSKQAKPHAAISLEMLKKLLLKSHKKLVYMRLDSRDL
jgi:hypothetical protein